ncbi:UDP-4-amino-4,6-dideoxy-N-acetyl-beta-L-altrosamine N-acetyltransferase [Pseudomonas corrugata]|uniref:UDP-4-amino-4, 6-dideoxy-N-acetyl-beta-L-altrosamine N-acetyltransferase n=1 Tax=Pseudomonas corrugata TaxID=47879 RepID=UPI001EE63D85|nr:UDP-4-amino-4,6-dideoxy-N-acetyl-beta-L-altrosamine N-acetyltransferase [Pseudomonas corrugata]
MDSLQQTSSSIRMMTSDDLDTVLTWRNHPDVRRFMYSQHEILIEEHRAWFRRASDDPKKHLLIFEMDGLAQGFANITELAVLGVADWGFYIAPEAQKGAGKLLGQAALDYAFQRLHLHKICGQALAFNERSVRFHYNLGFKQEGILRDQYYDGENYHAIICFGLLKVEWQPNWSQVYAKS